MRELFLSLLPLFLVMLSPTIMLLVLMCFILWTKWGDRRLKRGMNDRAKKIKEKIVRNVEKYGKDFADESITRVEELRKRFGGE